MFTHLHVHTEYSLLDGMSRIPELVARAAESGMDALAITDHGVMHGAIEFYEAARSAGIKPILGCEVYVATGSRLSRETADKGSYHLVLLAKNQTGYANLLRLVTKAHLEGFYYKPRVDRELLIQHKEGLIGLSACIGGELPQLILAGRLDVARESAAWYRDNMEGFYLEIQRHPLEKLDIINPALIEMGKELGIPLVATNDVHYLTQSNAAAHDLLWRIGTNTTTGDTERKRLPEVFYLKSQQEMADLFSDLPEALENAAAIAGMCDVQLEFGRLHLPEISLPPGKTPDQFLAELCRENLSRYYPDASEEIRRRLDYELDVVARTEFANYFLVVWDIISFVRERNILFGVRGSAAASIVLHCLGITQVDPIEHKLVFERFLNLERREMPDIDLDFQDDRRDEVIAYVSAKYGQDHVAQIITFGTLGARAAIRDVGRALGMEYGDVDRVARLIPTTLGITLERALAENTELGEIYRADPVIHKLVDAAREVEGISRHASTHAAGVVISSEPLVNHVPLQRSSRTSGEDGVMTQFSMGDIARIGLLKMDFLGLANLTTLGRALEIIKAERGIDIDLYNLPMEDARTFDLLASGETTGVFQLEGAGMRRYIRELKPTTFSDISAMVALYRPGPMEHIPTFIEAAHGRVPIRYPHPVLEEILKETYGVIVYQDQVLFIVQAFAGYSLGQADIFRKAMGKKIAEVMRKEKKNFVAGARKKGFTTELAEEIFALIEPFAGYAFNKAHSVSYALIAYQTAYLKANYPAEYMSAYLAVHADQTEKVASTVAECQRLGIEVKKPDINLSRATFNIEKDESGMASIRFGLAAIKNVGQGVVEAIDTEREKAGPFTSIEDLCRRCDLRSVNRRVMESLIKAGAMDPLGDRGSLLASVGGILSLAQREQRLKETGQVTMFDLWGDKAPVPMPGLDLTPGEVSNREKAAWEKELMGVPFSEPPFRGTVKEDGLETRLCGQVAVELAGQDIVIAGRVASVRSAFTKNGQPFASVVLSDVSGEIEVMAWSRVYKETMPIWQDGAELVVRGKVRVKEDRVQLACDAVRPYVPPPETASEVTAVGEPAHSAEEIEPVPATEPVIRRRLAINLKQTHDEEVDNARLEQLRAALGEFPGSDEVMLSIANGEKTYFVRLNSGVGYCPELHQKLAGLVAPEDVRLETSGQGQGATGPDGG